MLKYFISLLLLFFVVGCALDPDKKFNKSREEIQKEKLGKLTGDGIIIGNNKKSDATNGINVNSYIWRAALDTVYKMPINAADPFGGTIITDWYYNNKNERYKLNIIIVGTELRSDAVKVSAFKQHKSGGEWQKSDISNTVSDSIVNNILLRAREVRANIQ